MNNESLPENGQSSDQINSIGPRLKHARESLHLTITDVARQLRLTVERIHLLENNHYENMSGVTFVKGYLRAYARLVNLPADEIIAEFERLNLMPETKAFSLSSRKAPISLEKKSARRIIYFVGIGLLILVAVWWNSVLNTDAPNLNTASASAKQQSVQNHIASHPANTVPPTGALNVPKNPSDSTIKPEAVKSADQEAAANAMNANAVGTSQQHDKLATPSHPSSDATSTATASSEAQATENSHSAVDEDVSEAPVKPRKKAVSRPRHRISEPFDYDDE